MSRGDPELAATPFQRRLGLSAIILASVAIAIAIALCFVLPTHRPSPVDSPRQEVTFLEVDGAPLQTPDRTISTHIRDRNVIVEVQTEGKSDRLTIDEHASVNSRWFVAIDKHDAIWFYSGDVGLFAYRLDARGNYERLVVGDDSTLAREMPEQVFAKLGSATQDGLRSTQKRP